MRPYRRSVPITALPCLRKSGAQHASIARLATREVILLQRHIEQPFQNFGLLRAGNGLLPCDNEAGHAIDPETMGAKVFGMHRLSLLT